MSAKKNPEATGEAASTPSLAEALSEGKGIKFAVRIDGEIRLLRNSQAVWLHLVLDATDLNGIDRGSRVARFTVPADLFKDEQSLQEWSAAAVNNYVFHLSHALLLEAEQHLHDVGSVVLDSQGVMSVDMRDVFEAHLEATKKRLKEGLALPKPGVPPRWEKRELAIAVSRARASIPDPAGRTYQAVAEKLRESHPDRAPESGEALRKVLKRQGLSWRGLKSGRYVSADASVTA